MSIHTILSQMEESFYKEDVWYEFPCEYGMEGNTHKELSQEKVKKYIRSLATRIVEEVGKELIGEDEKVPEDVQWKGIHFINEHKPIHRNQLREEQRTKLQKIKEI